MHDGTFRAVEAIVPGDILAGQLGSGGAGARVLAVARAHDDVYTLPGIATLAGRATVDGAAVDVCVDEGNSAVVRRGPLQFSPRPAFPLSPWVLGVWLGDGHSAGCRLTSADGAIVDRTRADVADLGLEVRKLAAPYSYGISSPVRKNAMMDVLRRFGLVNNKHMPDDVKLGDVQTRRDVLAGLLDTDGCFSSGRYEICQKNRRLADDIAFVARSLGLRVSLAIVTKACFYAGRRREGEYARVLISGRGLCALPLVLDRKRCPRRVTPPRRQLASPSHAGAHDIVCVRVADGEPIPLESGALLDSAW